MVGGGFGNWGRVGRVFDEKQNIFEKKSFFNNIF